MRLQTNWKESVPPVILDIFYHLYSLWHNSLLCCPELCFPTPVGLNLHFKMLSLWILSIVVKLTLENFLVCPLKSDEKIDIKFIAKINQKCVGLDRNGSQLAG